MKTFNLDRAALLRECAAHTGKDASTLNLADLLATSNAETIVNLLRLANEGSAIRGPHPSIGLTAFAVKAPDAQYHALVAIHDQVSNLLLASLPLAAPALHHSFYGPRSALGPAVICEIVEAVLGACEEVLGKLIGGFSLFSVAARDPGHVAERAAPFTLMTWDGRPLWLCKGQPAQPAAGERYYLTEYRLGVLSEQPIPEEMTLADVLDEAHGGSYVADKEDAFTIALTPRRCAEMLIAFGSEPNFFDLEEFDPDPVEPA